MEARLSEGESGKGDKSAERGLKSDEEDALRDSSRLRKGGGKEQMLMAVAAGDRGRGEGGVMMIENEEVFVVSTVGGNEVEVDEDVVRWEVEEPGT